MGKFGDNAGNNPVGYIQYQWDGNSGRPLSINPLGGSVGIGTTAPRTILHVKTTTNNVSFNTDAPLGTGLLIESSQGTSSKPDAYINFWAKETDSSTTVFGSGRIRSGWELGGASWGTSYIALETHATNTAAWSTDLIIKAGSVGIGTTNPEHRLHIVNDAFIDGVFSNTDYTTHGRLYLNDTNFGIGAGSYTSSLTDGHLYLWAYGAEGRDIRFCHTVNGLSNPSTWSTRMTITGANGSVGIGTLLPQELLHVEGFIRSSSGYKVGTTTVIDSSRNLTNIGTIGSGSITSSGGITATGFLRIGTRILGTRPDSDDFGIGMQGTGSDSLRTAIFIGADSGTATINSIRLRTNATDRVTITSAGSVGIGTTLPQELLQVEGNIALSGANRFIGTQTNHNLSLRTNNTDRVIIDNSGNVGIVTTVASYNLHVVGRIYATGNITAFSDSNLKTNILSIENAIDKIKLLNGYTFNTVHDSSKRYVGLFAQDVEKVLPEAVEKDNNGLMSIAYGNLTGLLVNGIKELLTHNNSMVEEIQQLKHKLNYLEQEFEDFKKIFYNSINH